MPMLTYAGLAYFLEEIISPAIILLEWFLCMVLINKND